MLRDVTQSNEAGGRGDRQRLLRLYLFGFFGGVVLLGAILVLVLPQS